MPNEPPQPRPPLRSRIYARLVADRGPGKKKLWVLIAIPLGVLAGLGCLALLGVYIWLARGLPSIDWARHYRPPIVTTIWSGDENLIGEFYNERRVVVPYEKIPKRLKQAVIASEDAGFFEHGGVSSTGLLRGLFQTYVLHRRVVGGSTLSQQTAKAILLGDRAEADLKPELEILAALVPHAEEEVFSSSYGCHQSRNLLIFIRTRPRPCLSYQ